MVLDGPAAGGAPDFEKVRTDSTEVPKIPPPGDAWLVPRISMHGACTNYPCASNQRALIADVLKSSYVGD